MDSNGNCNQRKEIEAECSLSQLINNTPINLKTNLKNIDIIEKPSKNEEDNNQNNDNEDSLSYTTLYRSSQSSFNKNSKDFELSIQRRLSSNISTSQSDINYQDLNGLSSDKQFNSQKSIKEIQPLNLFGNDFSNLAINYYKETQDYLKNLHFNKNDYRHTKNYIEKEKYYDDYDEDNNDENKHNKIEFSEEKYKIINKNDNTNSFLSFNKEISNNNEEKPFIGFNKILKNNYNEKNRNNINITNINNNCFINPVFINPNNNFNNINGSKYDVSMYYLGYYSVDCKS